ncbi:MULTISPECIES: TrmH family RNA methyltransferase [Helicobacter]|uniref:RNA methyltransferase, TrmH family, group 3 n=1 Tax=Helicobacter bilis ATCC 43879 TaxID=613026 RepID=C3XEF8_9HELI|nr:MULTISPECIES: RNA methyltransferase [Helicobacter]EEO23397.1 RNA methyltransferase, TrmH family, group 3 [Helicobacter bilis ATCC 43879]
MIIFGKQCFEYVIHHAPTHIQEIYLAKDIEKPLFAKLKRLNVPILRIDNKKAQSLARGKNHQGVFAKIKPIEQTPFKALLDFSSLVVLCGMSDIGNIGAIVRTAYALGIGGIVISDRDTLNTQALEGIFRSSSGALLNMPFSFHKSSLSVANEAKMKQFTLIGAGKNNKNILESTPNKWAIFIGREDTGLPQKLLNKLDYALHIAMCNGFDSLNASVAAGILIDRIQHIKKEYYG